MPSALQQLVDGLGRRLRCATVIDDPNAQLQVYNSQFGTVDESRRNRILSRAGDPDVAEYFSSFRNPWPTQPIRIPAKPEIGVESRVYMPIRHQGELLGHLWVFDQGGLVSEDDFDFVLAAAESAALVLNREQLLSDLERSRERELMRDLLSSDAPTRAQASEDLTGSDHFPFRSPVRAIVLQPLGGEGGEANQVVRREITLALETARNELTPGHILNLVRNDHGLILVSPLDPALRTRSIQDIATDLQAALARALSVLPGAAWRVHAGIGEEQGALKDALVSYEQARHAVKVSSVAPSFGPVTEWSRLGIYRMLSHFPLEQLASEALHPAVIELVRSDEAPALLKTLETYLDSGCDAKATASQLFIHRGTLYYRLKRITEVTGAAMHSGEERLAIHLSLKLGRLSGLVATE